MSRRRESTGAAELWWGRDDSPGGMNPIENLWRLLKIRVAQKHAKSPDDLRAAIKTVWCTEVSQELCLNLVHSMPARMQAVEGSAY